MERRRTVLTRPRQSHPSIPFLVFFLFESTFGNSHIYQLKSWSPWSVNIFHFFFQMEKFQTGEAWVIFTRPPLAWTPSDLSGPSLVYYYASWRLFPLFFWVLMFFESGCDSVGHDADRLEQKQDVGQILHQNFFYELASHHQFKDPVMFQSSVKPGALGPPDASLDPFRWFIILQLEKILRGKLGGFWVRKKGHQFDPLRMDWTTQIFWTCDIFMSLISGYVHEGAACFFSEKNSQLCKFSGNFQQTLNKWGW